MELSCKYNEIYDLLEEKSKFDTASEPYKSKYEARQKLEELKSILSSEIDKNLSDDISPFNNEVEFPKIKAQLAAVLLQLGIIGLETEELSTGQEHLEKVLELISGHEIDPFCICIAVLCHNNIAILWAQRDQQEKANINLKLAKELYSKYRCQDEAKPPFAVHEFFLENSPIPGGWNVLEKLHTLTLYYLAQVMGKLGQAHESAHLCLSTLHRQLSSGEYQKISWSINAATLAKFFQDNQKYRMARRLLAAAWTMLECPSESETSPDLDESDEEKYLEAKAEVARRWGMYCVTLLVDSYDDISNEETTEEVNREREGTCDNLNSETTPSEERFGSHNDEEERPNISEEDCLEQMEFCKLELSSVEEKTDCQKAKTYEDAKRVFMSGLRWLNDARSYYTLDDNASTHTQIIQDTSALYRLLALFDPAPDRRSKMHKRRVNLLTTVLEELNSQYYLNVCRQLDFELGETYSAMVDCKYEVLGESTPNATQAVKINLLVMKSIKHFQDYLSTFNTKNGSKPEKYPEDSERPVLVAYFYIGRLWSKVISDKMEDKLMNANNTLENYKYLVDYCDKDPESAKLMPVELPVCREMVELLPYKIRRLREQV